MDRRTSYMVVGTISGVVGVLQIYQSIYDRPAGGSMSVFGLAVGLSFLLLGMWLAARGRRKP
jgi:sulfite exporter TauE/SafE